MWQENREEETSEKGVGAKVLRKEGKAYRSYQVE